MKRTYRIFGITILSLVLLAAVLLVAVLAMSARMDSSANAAPQSRQASPGTSSLNSFCGPAADRPADIPGDAAYELRLINNGSQAIQVTQVAVIFYGADGTQIGSDDPAQQDFPGDQEPISSFNTILIGAGQSITIPMETDKISGAAGNWTCQLGSWADN